MTLVQLIANVAMRDELTALLKALEVDTWQAVEPAIGRTAAGQPRMNDAIWPGYSTLFFVPLEDDAAESLLDRVAQWNETLGNDERITALSWPLGRVVSV